MTDNRSSGQKALDELHGRDAREADRARRGKQQDTISGIVAKSKEARGGRPRDSISDVSRLDDDPGWERRT